MRYGVYSIHRSVAVVVLMLELLSSGCATRGRFEPAARPALVSACSPANASPCPQLLVRAESAWRAELYPHAAELYENVVEGDSSVSVAVFRLATLRAWSDRLPEAERLYRRYIVLEPHDVEGRVALARTLGWSGRYGKALAIYDSIIARDSTCRDAVLGRAQTLIWDGQGAAAVGTYRAWAESHPSDRDARIQYARALATNGQLDDAEQVYLPLARLGDVEARKGMALMTAWRGDLPGSLRAWQDLLRSRPADPEVLTGLAQVSHWLGRDADAEAALRLALGANPRFGEALALRRSVTAALRPGVAITTAGSDDSDQNRAATLTIRYEQRAGPRASVGARYNERRASLAATSSRSDGMVAFLNWQSERWSVRGNGGLSHEASQGGAVAALRTIGQAAVAASVAVIPRLTVTASAVRAPFDETALLIASGVISTEYGADVDVALPARLTLTSAFNRAHLTNGSRDNWRHATSASLQWHYNRRWSASVGARAFGYDTTSSDGYFAPSAYLLTELGGRGHLGGDLGWNADADLAVGRQSIAFQTYDAGARLTERLGLTTAYGFDPAHEITLTLRYANVGGAAQSRRSEYWAYMIALGTRLVL